MYLTLPNAFYEAYAVLVSLSYSISVDDQSINIDLSQSVENL